MTSHAKSLAGAATAKEIFSNLAELEASSRARANDFACEVISGARKHVLHRPVYVAVMLFIHASSDAFTHQATPCFIASGRPAGAPAISDSL
jgi:hypothetical protein